DRRLEGVEQPIDLRDEGRFLVRIRIDAVRSEGAAVPQRQDIVFDVLPGAPEDLRPEGAFAQAILDRVKPASLDRPGAVVLLPLPLRDFDAVLLELEFSAPAQVFTQALQDILLLLDSLVFLS